MVNGLNIDADGFKKLPVKQQMSVLYENTEEIRQILLGYKFQQKVQWAAIGALFLIVGAGKFLGII